MDSPVAEGVVLGGRYRVGAVLGRGGMAQVFDGRDMRLDRPVAIKLLLPELAANSSLRQRFEREAQAAARLSHPNVVAVYDAGEDGGQAYIIMERLGGESLADSIARGPVDMTWLRRLATDILAALGAAHAAGIVHRDIKPSNILMAADGRAKVADFGIASVIEEQAAGGAAAGLTGTGLIIGTPEYLAPERMLGEPATAQSDLYSVGVVLYEALTGRKPFEGNTPLALVAAASHGAAGAPDPASMRPDADPRLVAAIARAMSPDPAQRFASAAAMSSALHHDRPSPTAVLPLEAPGRLAAATVPIAAHGPGRALTDVARRRPGIALAAAAAVIALAVGALMLASSHGTKARATGPAPSTSTAVTRPPATTTPAPLTTPAPAPTTVAPVTDPGQALLALIGQLGPGSGPAYQQLATGLGRLASLPVDAQPGYAQALLIQAGNWVRSKKLSDATYQQVAAVLTAISAQPITGPATTDKQKGGGGGGD